MIKTIILDQQKVEAFLTSLKMESGIALVSNEVRKAQSFNQVEEIIMEFLEATKVKTP